MDCVVGVRNANASGISPIINYIGKWVGLRVHNTSNQEHANSVEKSSILIPLNYAVARGFFAHVVATGDIWLYTLIYFPEPKPRVG